MMWTQDEISSALGNSAGVFLAPGIMGAIAAIFKVGGWLAVNLILRRYFLLPFVTCLFLFSQIGSRDILQPVIEIALDETNQLTKSSIASQSLLLRKFLVKLIQRIGLVYLSPRSTAWRYKVGLLLQMMFYIFSWLYLAVLSLEIILHTAGKTFYDRYLGWYGFCFLIRFIPPYMS